MAFCHDSFLFRFCLNDCPLVDDDVWVYCMKSQCMAASFKVNVAGPDSLTSENILFPSLGTEGLFQIEGVCFFLIYSGGKA